MPPRRGRPDLRTKTIRQRAVYIYAPTEEMLATCKEEARRYGMPSSAIWWRSSATSCAEASRVMVLELAW